MSPSQSYFIVVAIYTHLPDTGQQMNWRTKAGDKIYLVIGADV
jgi:hypothetical protein